jgi:phage regulator Rha-like protein
MTDFFKKKKLFMGREISINSHLIQNKIYLIRGQKVMIDRDLAEMYDVETRRLKEQVRRNIDRFPEDFMFELTDEEFENWRSQFATAKSDKMGLRIKPFAFTEHGVLMLSSVLNSERAVQVNIQIMRVYSKMKEILLDHKEILLKLEKLEKKVGKHDSEIRLIFQVIKNLVNEPKQPKNRIGFKKDW